MKNLIKKLGVKLTWRLSSVWWKLAVKNCTTINVPTMDEIIEYFIALRSGLCILGLESREFKETIKCRLYMIIYWAAKRKGITLSKEFAKKSARDLVWEINASNLFQIRYNNERQYLYEYNINGTWVTPTFLLGYIWKLEVDDEVKELLYFANILLTVSVKEGE